MEKKISKKIYTLVWTDKWDKERSTSGTIEEIEKYHGYTLEVGNSWNNRIKAKGYTTIKSLINGINRSIDEKCRGYDRPYVHLQEKPDVLPDGTPDRNLA